MKSNLLFFAGLFTALGISWAGIVLGSNAQLGGLAPYYDDNQGASFPDWMPGVGARGQLVYKDLGCAACHTQQVRRPDFGSDKARGWGDRQSVARDYIYQPFPQLGLSRIGPDLTNLADRKPSAMDADDLLKLLYTGAGAMPPYRFLFEMRRVGVEAQPSDRALQLTGTLKPKEGWEVVPTDRAMDLVGYLLSLKTSFDYPEAVPVAAPKAEGEAPAAPAAGPAPAAGAKAPAQPAAPASNTPAASTNTPAPTAGASPTPAAGAAAPAPSSPAGASNAPAPAGGASPTPAAGSAAPSPAPASGTAPTPAPAGAAPAAAPAAAAASPTPAPAGTAPAAATGSPSAAGGAPAPAATGTPSPSGTPTPTPTGGKS